MRFPYTKYYHVHPFEVFEPSGPNQNIGWLGNLNMYPPGFLWWPTLTPIEMSKDGSQGNNCMLSTRLSPILIRSTRLQIACRTSELKYIYIYIYLWKRGMIARFFTYICTQFGVQRRQMGFDKQLPLIIPSASPLVGSGGDRSLASKLNYGSPEVHWLAVRMFWPDKRLSCSVIGEEWLPRTRRSLLQPPLFVITSLLGYIEASEEKRHLSNYNVGKL